MRFYAIPLADKGFVPVDEIRNPVRWYVEGGPAWPLLGPYASMEAADFAAAELNREGETKP